MDGDISSSSTRHLAHTRLLAPSKPPKPPTYSVGSTTDEHGHTRPVAFMPYRVNGQYIMEVGSNESIFLTADI